MAEAQLKRRDGILKSAVAPVFKTILPIVAFLTFEGCGGTAEAQEKNKGGDSTLVFQIHKAQKPTERDSVLDTIPKLKVPDVKTLEHYYPFGLTDSDFVNRGDKLEMFRLSWLGIEDKTRPFGLREEVIAKYSDEEKADLMARWEVAKKELIVAFLSKKEGVTPSNALQMHSEDEANRLMKTWDNMKEVDREMPGQRPDMK